LSITWHAEVIDKVGSLVGRQLDCTTQQLLDLAP